MAVDIINEAIFGIVASFLHCLCHLFLNSFGKKKIIAVIFTVFIMREIMEKIVTIDSLEILPGRKVAVRFREELKLLPEAPAEAPTAAAQKEKFEVTLSSGEKYMIRDTEKLRSVAAKFLNLEEPKNESSRDKLKDKLKKICHEKRLDLVASDEDKLLLTRDNIEHIIYESTSLLLQHYGSPASVSELTTKIRSVFHRSIFSSEMISRGEISLLF